jgi:hypothetical protein
VPVAAAQPLARRRALAGRALAAAAPAAPLPKSGALCGELCLVTHAWLTRARLQP